ncbi:MAG TPA: EAL domain-containing protein [Rectinemataceae bacterium]|nr:EAL domain-containing protein [Rectinemataceae bacterium]
MISLAAAATSLGLSVIVDGLLSIRLFLRGRGSKASSSLGLLLVASGLWSLFETLEVFVPGYEWKILFDNLKYMPIVFVPALMYRFGRALSQGDGRATTLAKIPGALVYGPALVFAILVWLDASFGIVRSDFVLRTAQGIEFITRSRGPGFWILVVYSYSLIAWGTVIGVMGLAKTGRDGWPQAIVLMLAVFLPLALNAVWISGHWSIAAFDPTPASFAVMGLVFMGVFARFRFLSILPIAAKAALEVLEDAVVIVDERRRIGYFNLAGARLLNLEEGDTGRDIGSFIETPEGEGEESWTFRLPREGGARRIEARRRRVGKLAARHATIYALHDCTERIDAEERLRTANDSLERKVVERTSELIAANERLHDELERRRETEKQLFYFALHDPLTGLANRSLLVNRLGLALERMRREPASPFALLYIDFDDFKFINDSHGHEAGDQFLKEVGARMTRAIRTIDMVSRIGGDEFVILLDQAGSEAEADEIASRVALELAIPLRLGATSVVPSASIGILVASDEHLSPEDLLRDADLAMYRAKASGKNSRVTFAAEMRAAAMERTRLTNDLKMALVEGGIELHFQPIVQLDTGRLVGCEALARWYHPILGNVAPDRFIPVAEEAGLIVPLGRFVLMEAARTAAAMRDEGKADLFIAVNVSARQLVEPDFAEVLVSAMRRYGLPHSAIHLELTESAIVENPETVLPLLEGLVTEGFAIKLDDFGTGYSSLAYLHRFPIRSIKIDRGFVASLGAEGGDEAGERILRGIISLGHELGKDIVAEGIETEGQGKTLASWGCDLGQGWHFGKPLPREEWLALVDEEIAGF